jgi:hypothetical protein
MLTEICQDLKNWFDGNQPKLYDTFEISGGRIITDTFTEVIQNNQYFRIIDSTFNDGVYQYTEALRLTDETFDGSIWLMAIPKEVITLADEIAAWNNKYGGVDSSLMSPFSSESFGGYSYTKASAGSGSSDGSSAPTWQSMFAKRLNLWRKI